MTRKGIRLFGAYVKENIGGIALAICAALMLTALFYLYELPKEPLIYALALVGAIALLPFLLKYAYIKKRHTELEAILNNIAQVLGELPPPHGVLEHDYSDMLKKLDEARNRLTGEYEKEIGDMLEQYTLWAHQIKTPIAAMRLLIQSNASADELAAELFKIEQYVETALGIMRQVGMTRREIRSSVRSQVLTVFFLPLAAAGVHMAFAFPMIRLILTMFGLTNSRLFMICALLCFAVFSLVYLAAYVLTAKRYYKIVSSPSE